MVSPSFVWLQPLWWWQIHLIQLPLNEQRETTSLWSFPFVRCIHSDYITWLSKWLCMQIIPSFLVDKASCTRQFESELSLHSLASLFPIKEGFFRIPPSPFPKGGKSPLERNYWFSAVSTSNIFQKKHIINWYCQSCQLGSLDIHLFVRVIITWD